MAFTLSVAELVKFHEEGGLEWLQKLGGAPYVASALQSDLDKGIKSGEILERQAAFGENRIPEERQLWYVEFLWESFKDFTIRLLSFCAVFSIVVAVTLERDRELSWLEGVTILCTVTIVCNVQAAQDWMKQRSFRRLNAEASIAYISVTRDGAPAEVLKEELVVGDIVSLGIGDIIEADGILISGEGVEVDESAMTGEPEDIKKDTEFQPFVFAGTAVKSGCGKCLVTSVGVHTMNGKITALVRGQEVTKTTAPKDAEAETQVEEPVKGAEKAESKVEEKEGSILREKLDTMASQIARFAFLAAGVAVLVDLLIFWIETYGVEKRGFKGADVNKMLKKVVHGIAIVIVAVPEGLPLAVTMALSLSIQKMQLDNNLVKHLDATETMGSATTICSDKTGTLTQNRMTVTKAHLGDVPFVGGHSNDDTCGKVVAASGHVSKELQRLVCENVCLTKADGTEIDWDIAADRWSQRGNKTDCALLAFSMDMGLDYRLFRQQDLFKTVDLKTGVEVLGLKNYPFSSARKRSGLAVPLTADKEKGPCRLYVKGASEMIVQLCAKTISAEGTVSDFTQADKDRVFSEVVDEYANKAMRTIGLAYRDFPSPPEWDEEISLEEAERLTGQRAKTFAPELSLTFLGICGIHDPIRDGVIRAIGQCNTAGVDVRMVTGDHKATAVAIAKECGILRKDVDYKVGGGEPLQHKYTALTGQDFRKHVLDDKGCIIQSKFDEVWPYLRVLARSSPEDKYILVSGLKDSKLFATDLGKSLPIFADRQVVAVTGDGTNDAPALRKAHVGFAMKITGTRVAQDAADILLLDDNFSSVVKACLWGRNVYDSICKFLQFQLTVNITAVTVAVIGSVTVQEAPLNIIQMLWVNLIMDSFGALSLATEPPVESLLQRPPYGKERGLLSYEMRCMMFGQAVYQLIVMFVVFFAGAGPRCPRGAEVCTNMQKGGFLNIESGIGLTNSDPPSQHFTVVFNVFVFMQLFNWLNCRKLHFETWVLSGVQQNYMFMGIWGGCVLVQILLVQAADWGGNGINNAVRTRALTGEQWLFCVLVGFGIMFWRQLVIFVCKAIRPYVWPERAHVAPEIANEAAQC